LLLLSEGLFQNFDFEKSGCNVSTIIVCALTGVDLNSKAFELKRN